MEAIGPRAVTKLAELIRAPRQNCAVSRNRNTVVISCGLLARAGNPVRITGAGILMGGNGGGPEDEGGASKSRKLPINALAPGGNGAVTLEDKIVKPTRGKRRPCYIRDGRSRRPARERAVAKLARRIVAPCQDPAIGLQGKRMIKSRGEACARRPQSPDDFADVGAQDRIRNEGTSNRQQDLSRKPDSFA